MKLTQVKALAGTILISISVIVAALIFIGFIVIMIDIEVELSRLTSLAGKLYPHENDVVMSMIAYLNDTNRPLKERGNMVWGLGRMADERAVPYLQAYYVDEPCDHEKYLCRRELARAITNCKRGTPWGPGPSPGKWQKPRTTAK